MDGVHSILYREGLGGDDLSTSFPSVVLINCIHDVAFVFGRIIMRNAMQLNVTDLYILTNEESGYRIYLGVIILD